MVYAYKMADQLNRVVVRKELNKLVTFVNELQKQIQRRLNYLESNIINKEKLKEVIKEDRGRITSLQEKIRKLSLSTCWISFTASIRDSC